MENASLSSGCEQLVCEASVVRPCFVIGFVVGRDTTLVYSFLPTNSRLETFGKPEKQVRA